MITFDYINTNCFVLQNQHDYYIITVYLLNKNNMIINQKMPLSNKKNILRI
jgi:hypothetical protein